MKKQILFLSFLVLAVLASTNASYAQLSGGMGSGSPADGNPSAYVSYLTTATPANAAVTSLPCLETTDPLHPQVGELYTYSVDVELSASATGNADIHWFVTDNVNIMAALNNISSTGVDPANGSAYIMALGQTSIDNSVYNNAANESKTIQISWNALDPSNTLPILLVTYVVDDAGCTDNIKVYRINPVFKFTLDLAAYNEDGSAVITDGTAKECVSPVESALYDAAANSGSGALIVDYGENWVFFSVTAAYFSHSWQPSFQVDYDGTVSDPIEVYWAYEDEAGSGGTWHQATESTSGSGIYDATDPVLIQAATGTDNGTGESIVVAVRIDHGTTENPQIGDHIVTLGVNGIMYDGSGYTTTGLADLGPDVNTVDGNLDGACDQIDYDDETIYTLTPRPDVSSTTNYNSTNYGFEPVNP